MTARFLYDTNVISEMRRARPHAGVVRWLESRNGLADAIAALTIGEIQSGIEILRLNDLNKAAEIERWLGQILRNYQIISMDAEAFRQFARIMQRRSSALSGDAMIVAIAQTQGFSIASRNVRDFESLGMPATNPFEYSE